MIRQHRHSDLIATWDSVKKNNKKKQRDRLSIKQIENLLQCKTLHIIGFQRRLGLTKLEFYILC